MRKVSSRVLGAGYDNSVGESQAIRISHVSDLHPGFVCQEVQIVRVGDMREVQNRDINVKVTQAKLPYAVFLFEVEIMKIREYTNYGLAGTFLCEFNGGSQKPGIAAEFVQHKALNAIEI